MQYSWTAISWPCGIQDRSIELKAGEEFNSRYWNSSYAEHLYDPKPWSTAVKRSEKLLIKLWTFEYIYIYGYVTGFLPLYTVTNEAIPFPHIVCQVTKLKKVGRMVHLVHAGCWEWTQSVNGTEGIVWSGKGVPWFSLLVKWWSFNQNTFGTWLGLTCACCCSWMCNDHRYSPVGYWISC